MGGDAIQCRGAVAVSAVLLSAQTTPTRSGGIASKEVLGKGRNKVTLCGNYIRVSRVCPNRI